MRKILCIEACFCGVGGVCGVGLWRGDVKKC